MWDHENFSDTNGNGLWDSGEPFRDGVSGSHTGPQDGQFTCELYDPILTGYLASTDVGALTTFKQGKPPAANQSQFFCVALPGSVDATDYLEDIRGCNPGYVQAGDWIPTQTGNLAGYTTQGAQQLRSEDPGAYWDPGCQCVAGSAFGASSPRLAPVLLHDPRIPLTPGRMALRVVKLVGVFLEGVNGAGDLIGRFATILVPDGPECAAGAGYLYNCPVPTRPTTWGSVKATYR
jgi:hypothetical protein